MANVLFISEARLKSLTAIHDNVEPNDLMPFVLQAQDIYVQDVLGTKFYNSLKTAVSGTTLTTEEEALINDYISPALANYSLYLAIPTLNYKFKNFSEEVIDAKTKEPSPYILVRSNLEAKISRSVFYELVNLGSEESDNFGVWSGGCFFPFMKVKELTI